MEYLLEGRVFDGQSLHENWIVRIDSITGKIVGSGERGSIEEKRGQKIIEQRDTTILPGLIDTHVHFFGSIGSGINEWATTPDALAVLRSVSDLHRLLRAGFTSVRELGTKSGVFLAKAAEEGHFESPRIISCSRALAQTGGDDDPPSYPLEIGQALASYSYFCDGPWECRRAVRKVVRDGGKVVKLYASGGFAQGGKVRLQFTTEEIRAIVDEAHRSGIKVAAHAYGEEALLNAINAGVDSIEHGLGLTPKTARIIKDRGIFYVPTLVTYRKLKPSTNTAREKMIARHFREDMELAKRYSLKVTMGSDIVGDENRPHGRNYEEIAEEAQFLGNREALVAATSRAAECLDLPMVGRIREGFEADVIIVRGNPLKDVEALAPEKVLHVFKSGKLTSNS
ncbi:MAG: amidohydrolase family protein [archaeon]|nr:amidohydrolase family protein [archaeon]